jgi:hypothetical protein
MPDNKDKKERPKKKASILETYRQIFFWSVLLCAAIGEVIYHDFQIHLHVENSAQFDYQDIPMLKHNLQLYVFKGTELNITDFARFTEVDVHDQERDSAIEDPADVKHLANITEGSNFSKVQLRRYLSKYLAERIQYSGEGPVYNNSFVRDTDRFYWGYKASKEFVMFTDQETYSYQEIDTFFKEKTILNYMNELYLGYLNWYLETIKTQMGIVLQEKSVPLHLQDVPELQEYQDQLYMNYNIMEFMHIKSPYYMMWA